jgi:O-antigen/teichoic acid export membrane protein
MNNTTINNKRIAKNTLLLYTRMFLVMAISLYTVRVVLNALGEVDYGVYNVVGGVVLMFSFLNSSLASASQRFFAFELGRNKPEKLKRTFGAMLYFYAIVCLLLLVGVECFGIWFLNNKLNIPLDRLSAANLVFQFSTLTFLVRMINTPFQALIIANEKMNVFAVVGIIEVALQLIMVLGLQYSNGDKLILYSILLTVNIIIVTSCYIIYAKKTFRECTLRPIYDRTIAKDIIKYSSWMMLYGFSEVFYVQGINMLLNIFFGTIVNSARAIAYQVYGAIKLFGVNFFKAVEPQMTKLYAQNDLKSSFFLLNTSSKLSFFLILVLSLPIITFAPYILKLWLKEVPEYTIVFTQLMLVDAMIGILGNPLGTMSRATGYIGKYSIIISLLYMANLPASYMFLKLGASPVSVFIVMIVLSIITVGARIILLKDQIFEFSIISYMKEAILPICIVGGGITLLYLVFSQIVIDSIFDFLLYSSLLVLLSLICCYFLGLTRNEKYLVVKIIKQAKRKSYE